MGSDGRAHELLQLISEGYVLVDPDYVVHDINAAGARMDGRRADALIGKSLWESWPNVENSELSALWERAFADHRPVALEHHYTWADGRQSWIDMRAFPTGRDLAIFFRDISDKKGSEEELKRAQAELMQSQRITAMGTMAATLAHELAQPLTAVANYVETSARLVQALPGEAREAKRALRQAEEAATRATELIRKLRAFVSRGQLDAAPHDLREIIADAGVLALPQARGEGVAVDFALDPTAKKVRVDAVQIQQVLVNLIRNAIEAMRGAPIKRVVIETAQRLDGDLDLIVRDSGPGFGDAPPESLFAPFSTSRPDGLGLGLSISRTIVEAHGGVITAEDAPGGGAQLRVTLPTVESYA